MPKAIVCGAGGFIGTHLVRRLVKEGYEVTGIDLKKPLYGDTDAHVFVVGDLRDKAVIEEEIRLWQPDEIYQLAADMGGAGFVFTGENDAEIMHNSAIINLNVAEAVKNYFKRKSDIKIFYSSSACVYPKETVDGRTKFREEDAYPAMPDNDYGWEKLFSERMYFAYSRNHKINVKVARFHNVYGPEGTYKGGREKAPAAICRKVAEADNGDSIDVWGDGTALRSYLYVDECVEGIRRFVSKDNMHGPLNIGSDISISVKDLCDTIIKISGKDIGINYVDGPVGVDARNSDNDYIKIAFDWTPNTDFVAGLTKTYKWIESQVCQ